MSVQMGKLCSTLIEQLFGETVRIVADDLFSAHSKTIPMIRQSTNLSTKDVIKSLQVLIKFRIVKFSPSIANDQVAEYSLIPTKILLLLRYSSYAHLMQIRYNEVAAFIVGEILREGCATASETIVQNVNKNADERNIEAIQIYRDKFQELVGQQFLIRVSSPLREDESIPKMEVDENKLFLMPDLNLNDLKNLLDKGSNTALEDKHIYWGVNFDRFHQEFRDNLLISALERRVDQNAGDCLKHMLSLMYARTKPWDPASNPISLAELKHCCERKSLSADLIRYLDEYLSLITSDTMGFISKSGEVGGGQFKIEIKKSIIELTWNCIEHIVTERFGSKAARIFRVVKLKKYIEQEDIQKEAMIPAKEAKLLIYKLMEENFLHIHIVRKTGGGGSGPAKAFYLFHIKMHQIVNMLLDICYKATYNSITRILDDKDTHKRLIDKSQKLETTVDMMRERGDPEEIIQEVNDSLHNFFH